MVATSGDKGESWEEVLVIYPIHDQVRAYDPEIWVDPDVKLWVFWVQDTHIGGTWALVTEGTSAGVWALTTTESDNKYPVWSEPRRLADGVMMCKSLVLSDGEWLLPVSIWEMTDGSAQMVVSNDRGNTWHVRGAVPEDDII